MLTTATCGSVLCVLGFTLWGFHVAHETDRLDRELLRLARHHVSHLVDHLHQLEHVHGHGHGHGHEHDREHRHDASELHPPDSFLGEHLQDLHSAAVRTDGGVLARSNRWPELVPVAPLAYPTATSVQTVAGGAANFRLMRVREHGHTVVLALDLTRHERGLDRVAIVLWSSIAIGLLVVASAAWWIAHRALRPIGTLTRLAERVTADALDERISAADADREFARLIHVFNEMLERLERGFRQSARFTADASHELKTPLTIMQGHVEVALGNAADGSDAQRALAAQLDEIQRLKGLVSKLLVLSRADAGALRLDSRGLDLGELVRGVCEDVQVLAPDLAFEMRIPRGIVIDADENLLQQAVQNLVSNATKYNRANGRVAIEVESSDGEAIVRVVNTGPEIDAAEAAQIFDRFFRGSRSRNRKVDGLGLGLSLAREIARAHGGTLEFAGRRGDENVFVLRLPC